MYLLRDDINEIMEVLASGKLLLYPTDTIWGIGCDATNEEAIARVDALKHRPPGKSYVILVDSLERLREYVPKIHPRLETLLMYHTRPLTVIYDKAVNLPNAAKAADGSVAFRITSDPFCKLLIEKFGKPILSTSANISGAPFPSNFGTISSEIIVGVQYVVKHRQEEKMVGEPSVIVRVDRKGELEFIRE